MSKKKRLPNVSRALVNFIVLCKLSWYFMLFSVVVWNFIWVAYSVKTMLGIDLIANWSLIH